jgi:hypothetical protein
MATFLALIETSPFYVLQQFELNNAVPANQDATPKLITDARKMCPYCL